MPKIIRLLNQEDLLNAYEIISENGSVTFDLETNGLSFKDDIFSIGLKSKEHLFWLPFETINEWRAKPKVVKEKKVKLKKIKLHENQSNLFGKEVEKIIKGINDDIEEMINIPKSIIFSESPNYEEPIKFLTFDDCNQFLKMIFSDFKIKKVAHNMKFDASFLIYRDIKVENWYQDSLLMAWMIKEDRFSYKLKELHQKEFGEETETFNELTKNTAFYDLPYEKQKEYNINDVIYTDDLINIYHDEIFDNCSQEKFFREQMMDVSEVLCAMEMHGTFIDINFAGKYVEKAKLQIAENEEKVKQILSNKEININSNDQLVEIFYNQLNYKNPFGGDKKKVDKNVLKRWADKGCKLSQALQIYRTSRDLLKFIDGDKKKSLLACVDYNTKRIYPTFNQHRTRIHRLSGSNPNMQNLPRSGGAVRECIIAPKGYKLLILDYGQIELRVFAHYSQDPKLLEAFSKDATTDIHGITRQNVIAPIFPELDKIEQRTLAKNVNFGVWYGISIYGLMKLINVTELQAQKILRTTFDLYSVNKQWINKINDWVEEHKWVGNCYGGKRRFYDYKFGLNRGKDNFIKREAVHFIISGTAACILKNAMVKIHQKYINDDRVNIILQIHDELILEIPNNFNPQPILDIMVEPDGIFKVPLTVDFLMQNEWSK